VWGDNDGEPGGTTGGDGVGGQGRGPTGDVDGDPVHPPQLPIGPLAGVGGQPQPVDARVPASDAGQEKAAVAPIGSRRPVELGHLASPKFLPLLVVGGVLDPGQVAELGLRARLAQVVAAGDVEAGTQGGHRLGRARHRGGAGGQVACGSWEGPGWSGGGGGVGTQESKDLGGWRPGTPGTQMSQH